MIARRSVHAALIGGLAVLAAPAASADVKPHPLFSDGAVLQRGMPVSVWGTARDGERVTVRFRGQEMSAAARDGRWSVSLAPLEAGGPFPLTLAGDNTVEIRDVWVGEVWVCGGQSNMAFPLAKSEGAAGAVERSADPRIRLLTIAEATSDEPQGEVAAAWKACGPDTVPEFSAVGYYFGRELRRALGSAGDMPVGLINTAVGGTPAEAWTPQAALEGDPRLKTILDEHARAVRERGGVDNASAEAPAPGATPGARRPTKRELAADPRTSHRRPCCLYNGMIAPLRPYAIRGVIWYQGEANANKGDPVLYRTLFPALIRSWREAWGQGDLPFLFVQLAPFRRKGPSRDDRWAALRESQLVTARTVPRTAMAVITDVGDENTIHPTRKEPVGLRLALAARALAYGESVISSGPVYAGMAVEDGKIALRFDQVGGGLVARDGPLKGFAIAGGDGRFVDARADIDGDRVVVSSPDVPRPAAVRYGWANYPEGNLWNRDGLPASPFRTDDFPLRLAATDEEK